MSFDYVMAKACTQAITLLYIYLYIWGLDLRLNNINYFCWYYLSPIIIISLYWTSETLFSLSITTSEYLICDIFINNNTFFLINIYLDFLQLALKYFKDTEVNILNVLVIVGDFNIKDSF